MRALLVMVHGSPHESANADMHRVVKVVRARGRFDRVEVGFMECNHPSIPDAAKMCVDAGATEIVAVPYFLHSGVHVADDLPTLMEQCERDYPNVSFALGRYIGTSEVIPKILQARATVAVSRPTV